MFFFPSKLVPLHDPKMFIFDREFREYLQRMFPRTWIHGQLYGEYISALRYQRYTRGQAVKKDVDHKATSGLVRMSPWDEASVMGYESSSRWSPRNCPKAGGNSMIFWGLCPISGSPSRQTSSNDYSDANSYGHIGFSMHELPQKVIGSFPMFP